MILPEKFLKRDYWQMVLKDRLPFLRCGSAMIRGHRMTYPHWPFFWGIFYEIFIDDNYRIDGLPEVKLIIDAGANIGVSAIYFAQTYPHAKIVCFEPNPGALPYLKDNVAAYANVDVHPYALAATEGTMSFYIDADIAGSSIASAANLVRSKRRESREIQVEARKLSTFITSTVDILKVDIEGGEWGVMEDLISSGALKSVRTILLEYHYDPASLTRSVSELLTMLEEQGFFCYVRRGAHVTLAQPMIHSYIIFAFRTDL